MSEEENKTPEHLIDVPEAVGVFDDVESLQQAIYDLWIAGFSRFDTSLLAGDDAVKEKLGSRFWRASELEDDPKAPRTNFVSEEAIGELEGSIFGGFMFVGSVIAMTALLTPASTLAGSIAAAVIGGAPGGAIGGFLARRVGKQHSEYYENQLKHDGLLLWVRTSTPEKEALAIKIMQGASGRDVHIHQWSAR